MGRIWFTFVALQVVEMVGFEFLKSSRKYSPIKPQTLKLLPDFRDPISPRAVLHLASVDNGSAVCDRIKFTFLMIFHHYYSLLSLALVHLFTIL